MPSIEEAQYNVWKGRILKDVAKYYLDGGVKKLHVLTMGGEGSLFHE